MAHERINDKEYIEQCIQHWGNHYSIAFFDPACSFFGLPDTDGILGYRITPCGIVVFGEPACPPDLTLSLTQAFHQQCHDLRKKICYVGASSDFKQLLLDNKLCASALGLGNEIRINPEIDPKMHSGTKASSLRTKWRHSIKRGLTVHEYAGYDGTLEEQFELLQKEWLAHRKGVQVYLAQAHLSRYRTGRRFYVQYQNEIVGLLLLTRLDAYHGNEKTSCCLFSCCDACCECCSEACSKFCNKYCEPSCKCCCGWTGGIIIAPCVIAGGCLALALALATSPCWAPCACVAYATK